jgi:hypothetical protein
LRNYSKPKNLRKKLLSTTLPSIFPIEPEAVDRTKKEASTSENKPVQTEAQKITNPTQKTEFGLNLRRLGIAMLIGVAGLLFVVIVVSIALNPQTTSQSKNTSNSSANALMNIEVQFFESVPLTIKVDGKGDFPLRTTKFTAQNSFVIEYSIYQVDKFQLKINGKVIKLSKSPMIGSSSTISKFEVTKANLNQVLLKGSNEN